MKTRLYILLLVCACSCQKQAYDDDFTTFAPVYFSRRSILENNLQVKYNGEPIRWEESRITVPEGEARFEFYDRRSGEVLAEKVVNISKAQPESFIVFQPTADAAPAFLDGNGQANETAAPAGFIKIKLANYAAALLPYEKTDIVVVGINANFEFIPLDTLEAITQNLGNEEYHLVPTNSDILGYSFHFRQHGSEAMVKDAIGGDYMNLDVALVPELLSPRPEKNIYTLYFIAAKQDVAADRYIKSGDIYYQIQPEFLYVD